MALIRKTHSEWQAGKLNGPGGKIEKLADNAFETPLQAMVREFQEEANCLVEQWECFCELGGNNGFYKGEPGNEINERFYVYFFRAFGNLSLVEGKTEEKLEIIDVSDLPLHRTISNLQWLIPMALTMELTPVNIYQISERV